MLTGKGVNHLPDHRWATYQAADCHPRLPLHTIVLHPPGSKGRRQGQHQAVMANYQRHWGCRKLTAGRLISGVSLTRPHMFTRFVLLGGFFVLFARGKHSPLVTGSYCLCHTEAVNTTFNLHRNPHHTELHSIQIHTHTHTCMRDVLYVWAK